jgi:hypothetical protein
MSHVTARQAYWRNASRGGISQVLCEYISVAREPRPTKDVALAISPSPHKISLSEG